MKHFLGTDVLKRRVKWSCQTNITTECKKYHRCSTDATTEQRTQLVSRTRNWQHATVDIAVHNMKSVKGTRHSEASRWFK